MIKLIIVEDETIMREGLVKTIPWAEWGFCVTGSAENGKIAYEMVRSNEPDVILTDIRMPVMDGIELLKRINEEYPHIKVVLLSGYEEFEYAKQGINYGASAYVLKLDIVQSLEKTMACIKQKIELDIKKEDQLRHRKKTILHSLARETLYGGDTGEYNKNELLAEFKDYCFVAAVFHLNNYYTTIRLGQSNNTINVLSKIKDIFENELTKYSNNFYLIRLKENELAIIRFDKKADDILKSMVSNEVRQALGVIAENVDEKDSYVTGIGNPYKGWNGMLNSYQEARHATMYYLLNTSSSLIDIDDVEKRKQSNGKDVDYNVLKDIEKKMFFAAETNDLNKAVDLLDKWFAVWMENHNIVSDILQQNCVEVLSVIKWRLKDIYQYNEEDASVEMEEIYEINDIYTLKAYMEHVIKNMLGKVDKGSCPVLKAIKLMEEHYMEKITLKEIAEYVYTNPSYLSLMFKEKTGKTFTEYLLELKMQMACKLLKNGIKVHDVAEKVGYSDIKHFREMFKKYAGVNPRDY